MSEKSSQPRGQEQRLEQPEQPVDGFEINGEQIQDLESEQSGRIQQMKLSLAGYLGRVTNLLNKVDAIITQLNDPDEIKDIIQSVRDALNKYEVLYSEYIKHNLEQCELERVQRKHDEIYARFSKIVILSINLLIIW